VKLSGKSAVQLTTCAYYEDDGAKAAVRSNDRVSQSRVYSICCPNKFFSTEFVEKIMSNRSDPKQQWIFNLIKGQVTETEVVYLESDEWMLVRGLPPSDSANRYLAIFKDLELHTIRDLRQRHLPMLRQMQREVRRWLARNEPKHGQYRLYFHYMPSVFQLHLHVCCTPAVDRARRQDLSGLIRNIEALDTWYRDALMLFVSGTDIE
jgi:hypothetical protein